MFYEAAHGLNSRGICRAGLMPYAPRGDDRRRPSPKALEDARGRAGHWRVHWIRRWNVARPLDGGELLAIKEVLAAGHPVACGLRWPKAMQGASIVAVPPPREVLDGHSIVLTGFADAAGPNRVGMFSFRNSAGPHWGKDGYGRMSYAYVRAYANDALWLEFVPGPRKAPAERFEAEALAVRPESRCEAGPQDMANWGGPMWGGGEQLFCRAERGGFVELDLPVRRGGRYRVTLLATAAPDYGSIRAAMDGKALGPTFDLYSGRVCPAGSLDLGVIDLAAGPHTLRVTAEGKDSASAGFTFGLDAVELDAAD
jgi:hypothetical protein